MFRWACFGLAAVAAAILLWMLNDLRLEVKRTNAIVAEHLPAVLANVKQGTETLAHLSKDIEGMRDLAGIAGGPRDRSLVVYADSVLDFLDQQKGQIGLEKLVGKGLKDIVAVQDWSPARARKRCGSRSARTARPSCSIASARTSSARRGTSRPRPAIRCS